MKKLVSEAAAVVNPRYYKLGSLLNKELLSSYNTLRDTGGAISVKNKDIDELRAELFRARKFALSKVTNTTQAAKEIKRIKTIAEEIGMETDIDWEDFLEFWQIYARLRELQPWLWDLYDSDQIQKALNTVLEDPHRHWDGDFAKLARHIHREIIGATQTTKEEVDADATSDFELVD